MAFVTRWDDLMVASSIPGAQIGLLPGEKMVALLARVSPGAKVPYQTHPTEQLVHMLGGILRIWINDEVFDVGPGDVVLIPPDVPHRGESMGPEDATYLEVLSPVEERYRVLAADTAAKRAG